MIAYGSYVKKEVNLMKSINQIEIFDTMVALLAGLLIVPLSSRLWVRRECQRDRINVCVAAKSI